MFFEAENMDILYTLLFLFGAMLFGYLFGSIPNGVIIGRLHGIDIRAYGSHNTGGTNVGRTLGKKAGILTMFLDACKAYVPLLILLLVMTFTPLLESLIGYSRLKELVICLAGISVLLGHTYPLFAHFQGGKAVSSMAGFIFFVSPILFVVGFLFFLILFKITKRISICSILTVPFIFLLSLIPAILDLTVLTDVASFNGGLYYGPSFLLHLSFQTSIAIFFAALFIIYRHKSNIQRIKKHEEPETHFENTIKNKSAQ